MYFSDFQIQMQMLKWHNNSLMQYKSYVLRNGNEDSWNRDAHTPGSRWTQIIIAPFDPAGRSVTSPSYPFTVHLCLNWTTRWEWSGFYTIKGDFHPVLLASASDSLSLRPPTGCWTIWGEIRGSSSVLTAIFEQEFDNGEDFREYVKQLETYEILFSD